MAQPRLVIGLDFGTTYTGVAYCDKENAPTDQIAVVNEWPGIGAVGNKEKAPSRIAYVPPPPGQTTGGTIVWGDLIKPRIKAPVHACMKLRLDDKQAGSRQLALLMRILTSDMGGLDMNDIDEALAGNGGAPPAYPGKDVVEIVADYLSLVRDTAYQTMRNRYGGVFDGMRKELVVTVPAVWSERAKDQTMKAVAKAEWGVSKTSMITEPEAAAIYTLRGMSESSNKTEMKVGDTFVLCDAGGGTVDLISYKITQVSPAFHVEEAAVGSGDKCGATYVEKEFLNWLEEWLGTERFNRIPAEKTRHGSVMINEFEMNKCQFTGSDNDMAIRLPSEAGITDDDDLQIEDGSLFMNAEQMQKIFDPCVNRVLELVDGQVAAVMKAGHGKPKMVFLVGGFGRNIYLFKKIQEYCTARGMQTRQPAHPGTRRRLPRPGDGQQRPGGGPAGAQVLRHARQQGLQPVHPQHGRHDHGRVHGPQNGKSPDGVAGGEVGPPARGHAQGDHHRRQRALYARRGAPARCHPRRLQRGRCSEPVRG
ncbi:hypothetical protein RB594_000976 [Gaeumannomyces avenae]